MAGKRGRPVKAFRQGAEAAGNQVEAVDVCHK